MQDGDVELRDLSEVFAAHGVAVAYLFGSRAEGTARPASDHDVAVLFADPEPAPGCDGSARRRPGKRSWAPTSTSSTWTAPSSSCVATSPRAGRLLYSADEPRRVRFEVDARLRWIEFRPVVADNGGAGGTFATEPRDVSL